MKAKIEKFVRTYIIPIGMTILAYVYYQQYKCQQAWWWLVLIGAILVFHYFFYFRKIRSNPKVPDGTN